MRILTISNVEVDEGTGSGYVIANYTEGLRRRGHQVVVFGRSSYEPLPFMRRALQYRIALGMLAKTLVAVNRQSFELIEYYGAEAWLSVLVLKKILRTSTTVVLHSNGIEPHYRAVERSAVRYGAMSDYLHWFQLDQTVIFELGFRLVDGVVTVSAWDADFGKRNGYGGEYAVEYIDNPLPDDYLGRDVALSRNREIGFCGNWIDIKGTAVVRSDVTRFLREYLDWRFTLVGVGESFNKAEHFPPDVLARISVHPRADRCLELLRLYHRFAVLIVPSVYESFGLVSAEAMACGCAVVGTRVGFLASLKDGEEAALMGSPASPSLFVKLTAVANDEGLRRRIALGGYRRVQSLRWDVAVGRLEAIYESWRYRKARDRATVD